MKKNAAVLHSPDCDVSGAKLPELTWASILRFCERGRGLCDLFWKL